MLIATQREPRPLSSTCPAIPILGELGLVPPASSQEQEKILNIYTTHFEDHWISRGRICGIRAKTSSTSLSVRLERGVSQDSQTID